MSTVRVRAVVLGCRGTRGNVGRRPTAAGLGPSRADRFHPEDDAMRFLLLDAIQSYEPGVQLTAIKNVAHE